MKRFRIRYYFECMQEDVIEASSQEEAEDKAMDIISSDWDMTTPRIQFVDSPNNDVEVTEIKEDK